MIQSIMNDIIRVTIIGSVIIGIIALVSLLLRKNKNYRWRYWVWLILSIRMLFPLSFELPEFEFNKMSNISKFDVSVEGFDLQNVYNEALPVSNLAEIKSIDVYNILMFIWTAGFLISAFYNLFRKTAGL